MPDHPTYRPLYKALHRPLTVCGVDRRLFFLALLLGAATFNLFYSFLAGLLMFGGLYGFALWATKRDPEMLRILIASSQARRRYDPGKHDPVHVEIGGGGASRAFSATTARPAVSTVSWRCGASSTTRRSSRRPAT